MLARCDFAHCLDWCCPARGGHAETGDNVYEAFVNLAQDQLEEKARRSAAADDGTVDVGGGDGSAEEKGCC